MSPPSYLGSTRTAVLARVDPTYQSKNVVITGASRGIGRALAREFLSHGHRVVISSKTSYGTLQAYQELRREFGHKRCMYHVANVENANECQSLAISARAMLGDDIDLWINNAGTTSNTRTEFASMDVDAIHRIVGTNLLGTLFSCFYALSVMNCHESAIVNFEGSGVNSPSVSGYIAYSTSKVAVRYFTDQLRSELNRERMGVRIHSVSPGLVMTDMLRNGNEQKVLNTIAPLSITAEECAAFVHKELMKPCSKNRNIVYLTPLRFLIKMLTYPFDVHFE